MKLGGGGYCSDRQNTVPGITGWKTDATFLAHGTRARSARGSQNCAILSIICPFTGNSPFRLRVNNVVLGLPCRKDATEVFFCEVHTNKYIINTVLPSS